MMTLSDPKLRVLMNAQCVQSFLSHCQRLIPLDSTDKYRSSAVVNDSFNLQSVATCLAVPSLLISLGLAPAASNTWAAAA